MDVRQFQPRQLQAAAVAEQQLAAAVEADPGHQHPFPVGGGPLLLEARRLQLLKAIDRTGGVDRALGGGQIAGPQGDHIAVVPGGDRRGEGELPGGSLPGIDGAVGGAEPGEAVDAAVAVLAGEGPQRRVAADRPAAALQQHRAPVGLQGRGRQLGAAQGRRRGHQLGRADRAGGAARIEPNPVAEQQIGFAVGVLEAPHRRQAAVLVPAGGEGGDLQRQRAARRAAQVDHAAIVRDHGLQAVGPGLEGQGSGAAGAPAGLEQLVAEPVGGGGERVAGIELGLEATGIAPVAGGIAPHHLRTGGGGHPLAEHGDLAEAGAGLIEAGLTIAIEIL